MNIRKHQLMFLVFALYANVGSAEILADTNKLLDWAERRFPHFFSPPGRPTQSLNGWLYRYYPQSMTYAGVYTPAGTVHVLGPVFGPGIKDAGSLSSLLTLVLPPAGNQGKCVNVALIANGTQTEHRSFDPQGEFTGTDTTNYLTVSDTYEHVTQRSTEATSGSIPGYEFIVEIDTERWFHSEAGFWFLDRELSEEVVTEITASGQETYSGTSEANWEAPGLKDRPSTHCEAATWNSGLVDVEYIFTYEGIPSTQTSTVPRFRLVVDGVNQPVTTPAGNFNTLRTIDVGPSGSYEIDWYDIATGVHVKAEDFNPKGVLESRSVLYNVD